MRRVSLHARLAGWMMASTLVTLTLFAGLLYGSLRFEEAGAPSASEPLGAAVSEELLFAMLIAGPVSMAAAAGGAAWLGRRALRPLHDVIAGARRVTASDLRQRLQLPGVRDELHDLTLEVNSLLDRLDNGFGALARYAADASHEIRTPLAVLTSSLEVALRRPRTSAEWTATAENALGELRRLSQLVESLLALARADGPLEHIAAVDVREQTDQLLASLAARAASCGTSLSAAAEGDGGDARIDGDPDMVASAVRNLVDNALRYTPRGGRVRVAVRTGTEAVEVAVDDSGPGVPEAERESIFLPLRRGRAALAQGPGHGLGLAIVQRVAARHGGSVEVGASPEGGARFLLRLPRQSRSPSPSSLSSS